MNLIQVTKPSGRQWNILLDAVVAILKYKTITIDHSVYINVFPGGTLSYITCSNNDFIYSSNNETAFPELRRVFEEAF